LIGKNHPLKWSPDVMNEAAAKVRVNEMSFGEAAVSYDIPKATLFRTVRKEADDVVKRPMTIQASFID